MKFIFRLETIDPIEKIAKIVIIIVSRTVMNFFRRIFHQRSINEHCYRGADSIAFPNEFRQRVTQDWIVNFLITFVRDITFDVIGAVGMVIQPEVYLISVALIGSMARIVSARVTRRVYNVFKHSGRRRRRRLRGNFGHLAALFRYYGSFRRVLTSTRGRDGSSMFVRPFA